MFKKLYKFFSVDVWEAGFAHSSKKDNIFRKTLKVILLSCQGFRVDRCSIHASALTYYTLLGIVPVLALAFAVAKGFELDAFIEQEILDQFTQYKDVTLKAIEFARNLLNETKGGLIAAVGIVFLVWSILKVLSNIETSFNHIWLVDKGRSWKRKVTDYLSVGWIFPFLIILSNTFAALFLTRIVHFTEHLPLLGAYANWLFSLLHLVPFVATWALFTFIYMFMPNTHVQLRAGCIAGFIGALIYHIFQGIYVYFQIGISSYGAIYGSFAAFPLFLIWVQISWMILLLGAEVSYAIQNLGIYGMKQAKPKMNLADERLLLLGTMQLLVKHFNEGKPPVTLHQIAKKLGVPYQVAHKLINMLINCHLVVHTINGDDGYQPAVDTSTLTILDTINQIERQQITTINIYKNHSLKSFEETLQEMEKLIRTSSLDRLIKEI